LKSIALIAALALAPQALMASETIELDPTEAFSPTLEADHSGLSFTAGASTLGATLEAGYRFNNRFGVRVPFGSGEMSYDGDYDGNDFEIDAQLGGVGVLADFYPFGGGLRLSGGAFNTDYQADFVARDVDFGGYQSDVYGEIRQKEEIAPAVVLGYDGKIGKHFVVSADVGALFGKGFNVSASESSGQASQGQIDAEIEEFRDMAEKAKTLPFVRFSIGMKF
jgi:hypothetical protein